jgi:hypothetical protein
VWQAEQRGEEEQKKVIELQKQIAEERQVRVRVRFRLRAY